MSIEIKPSSERKCTNIPALVFAIVFIAMTVILVTYCGIVASTKSKTPSHNDSGEEVLIDSCGNICGQNNQYSGSSSCGGSDKRDFPKLLSKYVSEENSRHEYDFQSRNIELTCVKECPKETIEISNMCIDNVDVTHMISALKATWYYIFVICFVAFVFSYIFLILFRHAAIYVIWVINISFVILLIGLAILNAIKNIVDGAIIFGISALISFILLICFRNRIALVAKLFKEASKALIDVPAIMFEPILTFISLLVSSLIFGTFVVIVALAGDDEPLSTPAHICNLISFIFITQFIIGCQNFIIAGTICRWYFTRDKTKLEKPIKKSFSHLFKFHLGSVCLGAILITIVKIIKAIIASLRSQARNSRNLVAMLLATCCMCLFDIIDHLLAFLIRNAYVVVAKEGTGFCDSGRRAYRLLMDNICDVIALNRFGDIVLFVCRLLIVLIAGCVGYTALSQEKEYQDYIILPMIIGCILAFLIAHCFIMVFEMTVDTIFISFCIDLEENDGQTKPFYMSDGLKNIIMDMKEQSGGTLLLGPKGDPGIENGLYEGNEVPMIPPHHQQQQQMYPQMGFNNPPPYTQLPHTQQPYPQQNMLPSAPYPV